MPVVRNWRIRPTAYVEQEVERIARAEGRSLSNALLRLLVEAIDHRRRAISADKEPVSQ